MSDFSLQLTKNFSRIMRTRRKNLGWSVQNLVDRLEELGHSVSRSTLSGLENGRNKDRLNLSDAIMICEALELPLRAFLFEDERAMRVLEHDAIQSKELLAITLFNTVQDNLNK